MRIHDLAYAIGLRNLTINQAACDALIVIL